MTLASHHLKNAVAVGIILTGLLFAGAYVVFAGGGDGFDGGGGVGGPSCGPAGTGAGCGCDGGVGGLGYDGAGGSGSSGCTASDANGTWILTCPPPPPTYSEGGYFSQGGSQGGYIGTPPTPPSVSCTPTTIIDGAEVVCSWSCPSGTTSAGIGFSTGEQNAGSATFNPSQTDDYGVQCSNGGRKTVKVTVLHPSLSISANPTRVRSGNASSITWSASNVNSCVVTGPAFSQTGTSGGPTTSGPIEEQSTYTLLCQTEAGPVSASVTVTLIPSIIETGE